MMKCHSKTVALPLRLKDFPGFSLEDLKGLKNYYQTQLNRHSSPEKRVGWKTAASQKIRFEVLARVGSLKEAKILDVGCGLGAFWGYLQEKGIKARYTGIDLFPEMVLGARTLYPDAYFETRSILASPYPSRSFDYSFLSGVFNVKVQDNWAYMKAVLQQALRSSRKAVAFNVLSSESGLRESNRFMVTPREIIKLGKELGARRIRKVNLYHPHDLTLFLYR